MDFIWKLDRKNIGLIWIFDKNQWNDENIDENIRKIGLVRILDLVLGNTIKFKLKLALEEKSWRYANNKIYQHIFKIKHCVTSQGTIMKLCIWRKLRLNFKVPFNQIMESPVRFNYELDIYVSLFENWLLFYLLTKTVQAYTFSQAWLKKLSGMQFQACNFRHAISDMQFQTPSNILNF